MITETLMQIVDDLQKSNSTIDSLEKEFEPILIKSTYVPPPEMEAYSGSQIGEMVNTLAHLTKQLKARLESIVNDSDL